MKNLTTRKTKNLLFLSTIVFLLLFAYFLFYDFEQGKEILRPTVGTEDNPDAALEFRYQMIAGKNKVIDPRARLKAIEHSRRENKPTRLQKAKSISWVAVGPGNIGGRIRSIIIKPSDTDDILTGAVSGGIWKTENGGASWSPKLDDGEILSIGCMVRDPSDEDVIYAGTGEGWGNTDAVYGGGIYKSTDFGESWNLLASTIGANIWNFRNVLQMAFDPSGNLYAVTKSTNIKGNVGNYYTNGGLYKSTDDGGSWTKISSTTFEHNYFTGCDVVPISSSTILFAVRKYNDTNGGIYRTTNGGTNWTKVSSGLPGSAYDRIAFAQDPNNSATIYAVFHSPFNYISYDGLRGIYKSTDNGANWTQLTTPPDLPSTGNNSYLKSQGWYDNVIAVDPFDSDNIYVGGVDMMKSTDGGSSWSQLTYWSTSYGTPYVHADHHAIVFDPITANKLYSGNDGGIYKTEDGGSSWTELNNNLEITQFYGGAISNSVDALSRPANECYGGTQDNGHLKFDESGTDWTEVVGGDGGYASVHLTHSWFAFEEYVYLDIRKTTNSGSSWADCQSGLSDAQDESRCLFIAPFSMNPQNSSTLIAGSDRVFVTSALGNSWTASSGVLSTDEKISAVTIVNPSDNYLGFAGLTDGKIFKCTDLNPSSGLDTWTEITPPSNNGAWVRRITVDLNDKNKIYACYSGYNNDDVTPSKHVWYSDDQGTTWSDISGNLPDVPVHSLIIGPLNPQNLHIGTETGVYQTNDRGTTWYKTSYTLPENVPVDELVLQQDTNILYAFTHGRGVFKTDAQLPVNLISFTANFDENKVELKWQTATEVNNYGFEILRSTLDSEEWETIGFAEGHGNSNSVKNYKFTDSELPNSDEVSYRLKQIDTDGSFTYSEIVEVEIGLPTKFELSQNYPNPFNPSTNIDFQLTEKGFTSLRVYDILGNEVAILVNEEKEAGKYSVKFDAGNLSSGIYFCRLIAGDYINVKKMVLEK